MLWGWSESIGNAIYSVRWRAYMEKNIFGYKRNVGGGPEDGSGFNEGDMG